MTLYISMNTPSPDLDKTPISEAITFMATYVAIEKRNGRFPQTGPALDITFMLGNKDDVPPFHGMRMGGYSDENNTLYFETAVPEKINHSQNASHYVMAIMYDVVEQAIEFFAENRIMFDSEFWIRAVSHLSGGDSQTEMSH